MANQHGNAPAPAKPIKKGFDALATYIGYFFLGVLALIVFILMLRGMFPQAVIVNQTRDRPAYDASQQPAATTTPPSTATTAAPDISPPPQRFFEDVLQPNCHAFDSTTSTCRVDIRGSSPLGATEAGKHFCSDASIYGYWERWDPASQQWYTWNPQTDKLVISWQRFMPNPGVTTPMTITYWLC